MKLRRWKTCVLAGALLAAPAAAQEPDAMIDRAARAGADVEMLTQLRARASEAGLDEADVTTLLAPAVAAAEAGLPSRLLAQKALEGLAKRVPHDRIVDLLSRIQTQVTRAGAMIDPWLARADASSLFIESSEQAARPGQGVRSTLIESTALGLFHGAPQDVIGQVLERVPAALGGRGVSALEVGVAIEITPQLPVAELDAGIAADLVVSALASGSGAAELRELPAALREAGRRGELPAELVARGAIAQFRDLPAATVLQNLFQGEFPGNVPFDLPPGLENAAGRRGPPPPAPPPGGGS